MINTATISSAASAVAAACRCVMGIIIILSWNAITTVCAYCVFNGECAYNKTSEPRVPIIIVLYYTLLYGYVFLEFGSARVQRMFVPGKQSFRAQAKGPKRTIVYNVYKYNNNEMCK